MKRTCLFLLFLASFCVSTLPAQDAATQERLDKLSGQIEDVIATQRSQQKQLDALAKEIDSLREQAGRHTGNYATQEDAKRLADALSQVDRKRIEDSERVSSQLEKIRQSLTAGLAASKKGPTTSKDVERPANEKGYSYTIQSSDTLSVIAQAYRDKNIKVSTEQILKANPGLKPEKLKVGQKIWIPAPES